MKAKYAARCEICAKPIEVGDEMSSRNGIWAHSFCAPPHKQQQQAIAQPSGEVVKLVTCEEEQWLVKREQKSEGKAPGTRLAIRQSVAKQRQELAAKRQEEMHSTGLCWCCGKRVVVEPRLRVYCHAEGRCEPIDEGPEGD